MTLAVTITGHGALKCYLDDQIGCWKAIFLLNTLSMDENGNLLKPPATSQKARQSLSDRPTTGTVESNRFDWHPVTRFHWDGRIITRPPDETFELSLFLWNSESEAQSLNGNLMTFSLLPEAIIAMHRLLFFRSLSSLSHCFLNSICVLLSGLINLFNCFNCLFSFCGGPSPTSTACPRCRDAPSKEQTEKLFVRRGVACHRLVSIISLYRLVSIIFVSISLRGLSARLSWFAKLNCCLFSQCLPLHGDLVGEQLMLCKL